MTSIIDILSQILGILITFITYPITSEINAIISTAATFASHVLGPAVAIWNMGASAIALITTLLGALFPIAWITIILTGVTFVVLVRLYHFVKDIEIAGFKL